MNYLLYTYWIIRAVIKLTRNLPKLRKEVPEAIAAMVVLRTIIQAKMQDGLTANEFEEIAAQIRVTWRQADDVIRLLIDVIPVDMTAMDSYTATFDRIDTKSSQNRA